MNPKYSSFEGELVQSRPFRVIRTDYARHHPEIKTGAQLRSSLRAGDYAWPGGYQCFYITSDGAELCPGCVRKHLHACIQEIRNSLNMGWRIIGMDAECNCDDSVNCAHCGATLVDKPDEAS